MLCILRNSISVQAGKFHVPIQGLLSLTKQAELDRCSNWKVPNQISDLWYNRLFGEPAQNLIQSKLKATFFFLDKSIWSMNSPW